MILKNVFGSDSIILNGRSDPDKIGGTLSVNLVESIFQFIFFFHSSCICCFILLSLKPREVISNREETSCLHLLNAGFQHWKSETPNRRQDPGNFGRTSSVNLVENFLVHVLFQYILDRFCMQFLHSVEISIGRTSPTYTLYTLPQVRYMVQWSPSDSVMFAIITPHELQEDIDALLKKTPHARWFQLYQ